MKGNASDGRRPTLRSIPSPAGSTDADRLEFIRTMAEAAVPQDEARAMLEVHDALIDLGARMRTTRLRGTA